MAVHVRFKNEFKEDEKYHNLMTWVIYFPTSLKIRNKNCFCDVWHIDILLNDLW